jgi:hypothetical protein
MRRKTHVFGYGKAESPASGLLPPGYFPPCCLTRRPARVRCVTGMWKSAKSNRNPGRGTRCLGGFLASLVLFLAAMAASPVAHGELHHDACHADHECAITMFAQGAEPVQSAIEVAWSIGRVESRVPATQPFAGVEEPAHLRPPASGPPVA